MTTTLSAIIRWEEPPPWTTTDRREERTPWATIAAELKGRPGEWAVVYEGPPMPKTVQRIASGGSPWFRPAGTFEAKQRSKRGMVTLYARYIGETGAAA